MAFGPPGNSLSGNSLGRACRTARLMPKDGLSHAPRPKPVCRRPCRGLYTHLLQDCIGTGRQGPFSERSARMVGEWNAVAG